MIIREYILITLRGIYIIYYNNTRVYIDNNSAGARYYISYPLYNITSAAVRAHTFGTIPIVSIDVRRRLSEQYQPGNLQHVPIAVYPN